MQIGLIVSVFLNKTACNALPDALLGFIVPENAIVNVTTNLSHGDE